MRKALEIRANVYASRSQSNLFEFVSKRQHSCCVEVSVYKMFFSVKSLAEGRITPRLVPTAQHHLSCHISLLQQEVSDQPLGLICVQYISAKRITTCPTDL